MVFNRHMEIASSETNSKKLHLEIDLEAVEKLHALARSNGISFERVVQQAINHGLPLLGAKIKNKHRPESFNSK